MMIDPYRFRHHRPVRSSRSPRLTARRLLGQALPAALLLAATTWAAPGGARRTEEAQGQSGVEGPAFDRQINLVYTVNNLGYTDVCG